MVCPTYVFLKVEWTLLAPCLSATLFFEALQKQIEVYYAALKSLDYLFVSSCTVIKRRGIKTLYLIIEATDTR